MKFSAFLILISLPFVSCMSDESSREEVALTREHAVRDSIVRATDSLPGTTYMLVGDSLEQVAGSSFFRFHNYTLDRSIFVRLTEGFPDGTERRLFSTTISPTQADSFQLESGEVKFVKLLVHWCPTYPVLPGEPPVAPANSKNVSGSHQVDSIWATPLVRYTYNYYRTGRASTP